MTIGQQTLESRGLNYAGHFYWICVGALIGFTVLFNIGFALALTFLKGKVNLCCLIWKCAMLTFLNCFNSYWCTHSAPGRSRAIISYERYNKMQGIIDDGNHVDSVSEAHPLSTASKNGESVLVSVS